MKELLVDLTIVINVLGLTIISAVESYRPGSTGAAVDIGIVWLVTLILIVLALRQRQEVS